MKKARGKTKALFTALLGLLLMSLLSAGYACAETAIEVQDLGQIKLDKSRLWSPGRLAIGRDGTLYIVDSYKNRIVKSDSNGNFAGSIPYPNVSAVAVSPDNTLYIGGHMDYSVSISVNGRITGSLGSGQDEFRSIRDITVDPSDGRVYVADNMGNTVKIFDRAGKSLGAITEVNLPVAVAVSENAIYILDAPVVREDSFLTTASRISIFDKAYNFLGIIDDYAGGERVMFRPTDLAVAGGIIYVSDAATRSVILLNTEGAYIGEIQGASGAIDTAVALALSREGILYVSSNDTQSVQVFALSMTTAVQKGGRQ